MKKSQVTVFIIIAILIVVALGVVFLIFIKPKIGISVENTNTYIEDCMKEAAEDAEVLLLRQGGYIQPGNYKLYKNNKIGYICYNKNLYHSCIMQEPVFIQHLNKEIENFVKNKTDKCFLDLKKRLEKKGYEVKLGEGEIKSDLAVKNIELSIRRELVIRKEDVSKFEDFNVIIQSPLYDLAIIAQEIASQEAEYCNFQTVGYMILYPKFEIEKFQTSDAVKIYTITEKATQKKLNIAIRSCALPGRL